MVIVFFVCSFLNVVLNTMKTILTIKASRQQAAIINAITFGFYAIVIKQLAVFSLPVTVTVTIITNFIGVHVSLWMLDKFKKDKLWKITVTSSYEDTTYWVSRDLKQAGIQYTVMPTNIENRSVFDIYSENQEQSAKIKTIITGYYGIKYHVQEVKSSL